MKVKDIILSAALNLGVADGVADYFANQNDACAHEAELLLSCFNHVEESLARDYIPLYAEETLRSTTGAIQFAAFSHAPVRILDVKNKDGESVPYTLYPKYLKTGAGIFVVTYTYTPEAKTIDEESDFGVNVTESLLVYGVLAEYMVTEGRFEDASVWDKKYKESIQAVYKLKTCTRLKSRRWV